MRYLTDLVEYVHSNRSIETKKYIIHQMVKTVDSNKGYLWEEVLEKAMSHTTRLPGNSVGMDFTDTTDAKLARFSRKKNASTLEASISGIANKVGPLRVCLLVPGHEFHRLMYMFIPYEAYAPYIRGHSSALKVTLSPRGNVQGPLSKYVCSFDEVCKPYTN
jgi:hypothetical protein